MKLKEIKDLLKYPVKTVCWGEDKISSISYIEDISNKKFDNYTIIKICPYEIRLKVPDKYHNIREFINTNELNGEEAVEFNCTNYDDEIRIEQEFVYLNNTRARSLKIYNANTLEEKIEVLKILYGGNKYEA